jgi:site-specific DNA-methyltransferase (adenine-specific)
MGTPAKAVHFDEPSEVKKRAPRNRTLTASASEIAQLRARLLSPDEIHAGNFAGRTICGDCFDTFGKLPAKSVDVLILDPPYNLNKKFGAKSEADRNDLHLRRLAFFQLDFYRRLRGF